MDDRRTDEPENGKPEATYANAEAQQAEFEELVREEERKGDLDEQAFQDAVDHQRAGDEPEETPPSSTMP